MTDSVKILANIGIYHRFFDSGNYEGGEILPSAQCANILKHWGISVRSKSAQLKLITFNSSMDIDTLVESQTVLTFYLSNRDPYFFNYTKSQSKQCTPFFYLSNLYQKVANPNSSTILLTDQEFVSERQEVILNNASSYEYKTTATIDNIELKNAYGKTENVNYTATSSGVRIEWGADLSGWYQLDINGQDVEQFYFADQRVPAGCIGVLQLFFSSEFFTNSSSRENRETLSFTATFENNSTLWRYILVGDTIPPIEHIYIANTKQEYSFEGPIDGEMVNGQKSREFISTHPIGLRESYDSYNQLYMNFDSNNDKGQLIYDTLPVPSLDSIGYGQNKNLTSDIFIY